MGYDRGDSFPFDTTAIRRIAVRETGGFRVYNLITVGGMYTEKSFRTLIKSNRNQKMANLMRYTLNRFNEISRYVWSPQLRVPLTAIEHHTNILPEGLRGHSNVPIMPRGVSLSQRSRN